MPAVFQAPPGPISPPAPLALPPSGFLPAQRSLTRILRLADFNKDLKTRDIQAVFADWEDDRGGFKIKWLDDTSCLIVFAHPAVAKRAFLSVLDSPPPSLVHRQVLSPSRPAIYRTASLRPYNGPDLLHILASVQNRPRSRSSVSQSLHSRASSLASNNHSLAKPPSIGSLSARHRSSLSAATGLPRNSISPPSLSGIPNPASVSISAFSGPNSVPDLDDPSTGASSARARVDDAAKRFITAGIGKPNPAGNHVPISDLGQNSNSASYSLANLTIEEEVTTPTAASH